MPQKETPPPIEIGRGVQTMTRGSVGCGLRTVDVRHALHVAPVAPIPLNIALIVEEMTIVELGARAIVAEGDGRRVSVDLTRPLGARGGVTAAIPSGTGTMVAIGFTVCRDSHGATFIDFAVTVVVKTIAADLFVRMHSCNIAVSQMGRQGLTRYADLLNVVRISRGEVAHIHFTIPCCLGRWCRRHEDTGTGSFATTEGRCRMVRVGYESI